MAFANEHPPVLYGNPDEHTRDLIVTDAKLFGMSMFEQPPEYVLNVAIMLMVMALSGLNKAAEVSEMVEAAGDCVLASHAAFAEWMQKQEAQT